MDISAKRRVFGFVSGILIVAAGLAPGAQTASGDDIGWPREITHEMGTAIIYQPQLDSLKNNVLEGRGAVSVALRDSEGPVFGAFWFKARLATDLDTRTAEIIDLKIPRVRFPEATPEQEAKFAAFLEKEIPRWDLTLSLERLEASLELAEREHIAAANLKNDPPKIMVVTDPAVLVFIDGEPQLRDVENTGLRRVVNTPFLIVLDPANKTYYLDGGKIWMTARDVRGPWTETPSVPEKVRALRQASETEEAEPVDSRVPRVIVATEPSELIVVDGKPKFASVAENEILYVTNTDSDVLMEIASQRYFALLSGRWYSTKNLFEGPWAFVPAEELPKSFAKVSPESDIGYILAHVPGTEQARDAVLDAQIPQTSAVRRDDTSLAVTYDGQPQFERIEDTGMEYAVNTASSVIKSGDRYYCCNEAVWYESGEPAGPWSVCVNVPGEIYSIPPSCPVYNVKYVYVYDVTPEVVYVGYYPGYMGCYVYGPTIVYGTGWWYRPWWGYYYYPRPVTYGFHVRYNPWYGWSFGVSFASGPFRVTIGTGGMYGGWWGPGRYRPHPYYAYGAGYRAGYRAGYWASPRPALYGGAAGAGRVGPSRNIYNRGTNIQRNVPRGQVARPSQQPRLAPGRENNVFTDRNGDIFRNSDGGWQKREGKTWSPAEGSPTTRPAQAPGKKAPQTLQAPAAKSKPAVSAGTSDLNRQLNARQRGTTRTNQSRGRAAGSGVRRK